MRDLDAQQIRQSIDSEQLYAAYRAAERDLSMRFAGAMSWKTVKGSRYLYRKTAGDWKSLGPRSEATEAAHARFHEGRAALRDRMRTLDARIREMAPVNRALRLGRVPTISARLIRRLERDGALGHGLRIVGTHAMFAYEAMGGVQFGEDAISTRDIDLLYDARSMLSLLSADPASDGMIGVLRSLDRSFRPTEAGSFRAVNDDGFLVDLITPAHRRPATARRPPRIGLSAEDLIAAEIEGLAWLENAPAVARTVIDERGFPLAMTVPDPRAFLCHKLWIAGRDDRDPVKRRRDRAQAAILAEMLATRLPHLRLDDKVLGAVPADVLDLGRRAMAERRPADIERWDG